MKLSNEFNYRVMQDGKEFALTKHLYEALYLKRRYRHVTVTPIFRLVTRDYGEHV